MPTFSSFADFGNAVEKYGHDLERDWIKRMTAEQAKDAERIAIGMISPRLGGDMQMSGWTPEVELKVRHFPDGASLLQPTKSGAGPSTVVFGGRNQGNAGGMAGPGVIQSGANAGTTGRTKSGAVRKVRARKARRWNGTTDPMLDIDDVRGPVESRAAEIAERYGRKAAQQHFDVD